MDLSRKTYLKIKKNLSENRFFNGITFQITNSFRRQVFQKSEQISAFEFRTKILSVLNEKEFYIFYFSRKLRNIGLFDIS